MDRTHIRLVQMKFPCWEFGLFSAGAFYVLIPFLKLTFSPLKMDGCYVSFKEGNQLDFLGKGNYQNFR